MSMRLLRKAFPIALLSFAVWTASTLVASAQDAKKGEQVYAAQKCMTCHAISGKGNKNNPLDGVGGKISAAEIKEWITMPKAMATKAGAKGKPPMPDRYAKLPAADIDALVAYMQTLK